MIIIFLYMVEGMMNGSRMEKKRPRRLNFNAPLLSTRRPAAAGHGEFHSPTTVLSAVSDKVSCKDNNSCNGIPFCWEQAPGKPKNVERSSGGNVDDHAETPRPKPPPCRWRRPSKEAVHYHHVHDVVHDEGCDADVDDYDFDDVFSDGIDDVSSLTEAIDIVEKAEKFRGLSDGGGGGGLNLESLEHSDIDQFPSPNFIIERFLPDATALAASSTALMNNMTSKPKLPYLCSNYTSESPPRVSQAVMKRPFPNDTPKHCGLEMLLPWRMKHRLCGVKSPIKERTKPTIAPPKTSYSKHKNLFSSIVAPSADQWRCK